jgi:exopolysaccharide biosynthesis polyprenyl glycosylphosphotransferase
MDMKKSKKVIVFVGDLLALTASFFISLRLGYLNNFTPSVYQTHLEPFLIIYGLWLVLMFAFGLYEPENMRPSLRSIRNTLTVLGIAFLISLAFFYIFPIFGISPKTNLLINILVFTVLFVLERRLITSIISNNYSEKILLIGANPEIDELDRVIKGNSGGYYRIADKSVSLDENTLKKINDSNFDLVIFSESDIDNGFLNKNINDFLNSQVQFLNLTTAYEKLLGKVPANQIDEMWFITNIYNFRSRIYEILKRVTETILAVITLLILSPILLIAFIAIKIEDGGRFVYSHKRIGRNGQEFTIYKIRSMIEDSEKNGPEWAKDKDTRITKVGNIIRKSHLDESLQLINIIQGNISMIGPRPERPEFISKLSENINNYNLRHAVKPGITGWAQINYKYGNTIEDAKQKFEYDLYYIKNRNIFMDIGIIIRTIQTIFLNK